MSPPRAGGGRHRCVVLDDYQGTALERADWSPLRDRVDVECVGGHLDGEALVDALGGASIVVAMRERTAFADGLLARLPALRLLVTTGMVNAAIDMEAAARRGIVVCGTGTSPGAAAELAWALLLASVRNIVEECVNLRAGGERWQVSVGGDLRGRTLGVVGLGTLGSRVARYGNAFDMRVLGWSRSNTPGRSAELGVEYAPSLDAILSEADIVSLHVPLTPQTRGMLGSRELALMKRGATLVNTARAGLVDTAALIDALRSGHLRGAALDVFDEEPLPRDHPFRTMPNVVATPHVGYVTADTYARYFADAVENIAGWIDGAPVRVLNAAPKTRG